MTNPFDKDALRTPGPLIAAWDLSSEKGVWQVTLFSLATGGARELARHEVPDADHDAVEAALEADGIPVGIYDRMCDFTWLKRGDQLTVWSSTGRRFLGTRERLEPAKGDPIPPSDVTAVISFTDGDSGECGVVLETASGDVPVAVSVLMAALDPFHSPSELTYESMWTMALARQLASWLDVPYKRHS